MAPKNPARYGAKNSCPIATTVDPATFAAVQELAARGGISPAAWLRQTILEETARATVYGISRVEKQTKNTPETILMQDAPGEICELPAPGFSPAKPTRYQKGTGRK